MNLIEFAPLWLAGILLLALLAAAAEDIRRLRISNITVLVVIAAAIGAMAFGGFHGPLWQNAIIFAVIMFIGTFAFSANLLGGGDVKLLAAVGLWVNFEAAIWLIASIFLAGGIVAVIYIIVRKSQGKSRREANRIPYGVAIAAGSLFVLGTQYAHAKADAPDRVRCRPSKASTYPTARRRSRRFFAGPARFPDSRFARQLANSERFASRTQGALAPSESFPLWDTE